MKTVLAIIGAIVIALIIFLFIWNTISRYEEKMYYKRLNRFYRQLGRRIAEDAYWFVRDPKVFNTLKSIGRDLSNNATYDIRRIRDEVDELGETKIK